MSKPILAAACLVLACTAAQAQSRDVPSPFAPFSRDFNARSLRSEKPPAITYHIYYDKKEWGPYTLEELKKLAGEQKFFIDDFVWKSGATEWMRAGDYPELAFAPEYVEPKKATVEGPFWIDDAGQQTGPFTLDQMKARAESGDLKPGSVVWAQGMDAWTRASEVEALKPFLVAGEKKEVADQKDQNAADDQAAVQTDQQKAGEGTDDQKVDDGIPVPPDAAENDPPPPPDQKAGVEYYVSVGGKATGPFTADEIRAKIKAGEIATSSYLWWKGAEWTQAGKVGLFAALFDDAVKPPPFDCTGFLVGAWERREFIQGETWIVQMQFDANGQFQGAQGLAGYPGSNMYGTWTAEAVGEKTCSLTSKQQYPNTNSSTTVFDIIDRQSMKDKSKGVLVRRLW